MADDRIAIEIELENARRAILEADRLSKSVRGIGDQSRRTGRLAKGAQAGLLGLGRGVRMLGIGVAAAGVVAFGALTLGVKSSVTAFGESQKVTASTQAVIESTGGAAKVTNEHMEALGATLQAHSGISDEVIRTGGNVLLTFTRIRNELGKGNQVFDRATKVALDMSLVANGAFGDMNSASKMLGKALQDPERGLTALGRAGVTFTDAQKKQITALAESGKMLQAQKLILQEVETQVGGQAEAYGKTLPGAIARGREALGDFSEMIGAKLAPGISVAAGYLSKFALSMQAGMRAGMGPLDLVQSSLGKTFGWSSKVMGVWDKTRPVLEKLWGMVGKGADLLQTAAPMVLDFGRSLLDGLKPAMPFLENIVIPLLKGIGIGLVVSLVGSWKVVWPVLKLLFKGLGWIGTKAKPLKGTFEKIGVVIGVLFAGPIMKAIGLLGKLGGVLGFVGKVVGKVGLLFVKGAGMIIGVYLKMGSKLLGVYRAIFGKILGFIAGLGSKFLKVGGKLWGKLTDGLRGALGNGVGFVKDLGKALANNVIKLLNKAIPNKLPVPGAPDIDLPNNPIPMLAKGGVMRKGRNTQWISGEAGPEHNQFDGSRVRVTPLSKVDPFDASDLFRRGGGDPPDDAAPFVVYADGRELFRGMAKRARREEARRA